MARSDQTSLLFEVLEGPAAGAVVELVGRAMPYRSGAGGGISYGKTQRTKLTWYPGNRRGSQQIVGPTIQPTTFDGVWKDRYLGEDRSIDLVELFEELLEQGCQLRCAWQTIERQGVIKSFTWYPGTPDGGVDSLRWEMTCEWNADLTQPQRGTVGTADLSIRDQVARAAGALSDLMDAVERFVDGTQTFVGLIRTSAEATRRQLKDLVDRMLPALDGEAEVAIASGDQAVLPARLVEGASAAAGDAQEASAEVAEVTAAFFPANSQEDDNLEAILDDAIAKYDLIDQSRISMEEQYDLRLRMEEIARPDQFTAIVPVAGADLREVAIQYYGDADLWTRIAKFNGLENSKIPADLEELVIPLNLPDATDDRLGGI